jgi:hypothetical protein
MPEFDIFPVKFPVRRENGQSRVPSALRRQPASPVSVCSLIEGARTPANKGHFIRLRVSRTPKFEPVFPNLRSSLWRTLKKFPFCGVAKIAKSGGHSRRVSAGLCQIRRHSQNDRLWNVGADSGCVAVPASIPLEAFIPSGNLALTGGNQTVGNSSCEGTLEGTIAHAFFNALKH